MRDYYDVMTTCDGGRPSMEEDLLWKKTFYGSRPLIYDDLPWKVRNVISQSAPVSVAFWGADMQKVGNLGT